MSVIAPRGLLTHLKEVRLKLPEVSRQTTPLIWVTGCFYNNESTESSNGRVKLPLSCDSLLFSCETGVCVCWGDSLTFVLPWQHNSRTLRTTSNSSVEAQDESIPRSKESVLCFGSSCCVFLHGGSFFDIKSCSSEETGERTQTQKCLLSLKKVQFLSFFILQKLGRKLESTTFFHTVKIFNHLQFELVSPLVKNSEFLPPGCWSQLNRSDIFSCVEELRIFYFLQNLVGANC